MTVGVDSCGSSAVAVAAWIVVGEGLVGGESVGTVWQAARKSVNISVKNER